MPPVAQSILFCTPSDIMDFVGVPGAQLRLDDQNLATGQTVIVAVDAVLGATTLEISPLTAPLVKGDTLEFGSGGMSEIVEVVLAATGRVGATSLTVQPLTAAIPVQAQAQDNGVNAAWAIRLPRACNYATAEVKRWCMPRYKSSDMVNCWSVNDWAVAIGSEWICSRMLRAIPETVMNRVERTRDELKMVRVGTLNLEDIPTRSISGLPFMDNITVDPVYYTHKMRMESSISDNVPSQNQQLIDWGDAYFGAYEW